MCFPAVVLFCPALNRRPLACSEFLELNGDAFASIHKKPRSSRNGRRGSFSRGRTRTCGLRVMRNTAHGGYEDWFQPSKDELNLMYENLHEEGLGDFALANYWSSSDGFVDAAWRHMFFISTGGGRLWCRSTTTVQNSRTSIGWFSNSLRTQKDYPGSTSTRRDNSNTRRRRQFSSRVAPKQCDSVSICEYCRHHSGSASAVDGIIWLCGSTSTKNR